MLTFITHYWVQELCGVIVLGMSFLCKKFWTLYKKERENNQAEFAKMIKKEINEIMQAEDNNIKLSIQSITEELDLIKAGLLSVHKYMFYKECKRLLDPSHSITFEEYNDIVKEHTIYNGLGGNHKGDEFFKLI